MKIHYFFRTKYPGFNSIEELFSSIFQSLDGVPYKILDAPERRITFQSVWNNLKWARKNRGQVNHITGDVHYLALATGRNTVLTIHDVDSVLQGNKLKKWIIKIFWFWIPALIVKRITTISVKSKKELLSIIPFARKKIRVVPNPYNPSLLEVNPLPEKNSKDYHKIKPVILHLGTKPNKNLERTIQALKGCPCKLVVLGKLTEKQSELLAKCQIDFKSYYNLPYEEVALLYHQCDLVCFASTYEGFGMPIIEAQYVGKPVITSNISPMTWVAGEGACIVNPFNIQSIREGIDRILHDNDYRTGLILKGKENVVRFKPENITQMYLDIYKEVVDK